MITLNDLLKILDAEEITVSVPITPRLNSRIDVNLTDAAEVDDIVYHYGGQHVKSIELDAMRDELIVTLA